MQREMRTLKKKVADFEAKAQQMKDVEEENAKLKIQVEELRAKSTGQEESGGLREKVAALEKQLQEKDTLLQREEARRKEGEEAQSSLQEQVVLLEESLAEAVAARTQAGDSHENGDESAQERMKQLEEHLTELLRQHDEVLVESNRGTFGLTPFFSQN